MLPQADIDQLKKVLQHEGRTGYQDSAVVGGLDGYLHRWADRGLAAEPSLRQLIARHRLQEPGYGRLEPEERRAWVVSLLSSLANPNAASKAVSKPVVPSAAKRPAALGKAAAIVGSKRPIAKSSGAKATSAKPASARKPKPHQAAPAGPLTVDSPTSLLKGVTPNVESKLAKLGVKTVRDLLYFIPRRHLDYADVRPIAGLEIGVEQTVKGFIWEAREASFGRTLRGAEAIVGDETGNIRAVWFNQPYLAKTMHTNGQIVLSGKVSVFRGQRVFESPEWELLTSGELLHTGRLVPVYPLTEGLRPRAVRRLVKETVDRFASLLQDFLPPALRQRQGFLPLPGAIAKIHYPSGEEEREAARRRLAFDELFLLQLQVQERRRAWREGQPGHAMTAPQTVEGFLSSLPFSLTEAQGRALGQVLQDMEQPIAMSRLLQGDVGSGKTVVAAAALLVAVACGYQGAIMAPTEILAEQHFRTITGLLARSGPADSAGTYLPPYLGRPLRFALLTGSSGKKEKDAVYKAAARGEVDIIVGTHALIQEGLEFARLGLVVIDEQHRFGVLQRSGLRQKGFNPDVLVMTATPIPRTLALTLYGDLDISVIDELPPGRQPIATKRLGPEQREQAYTFIRKQVEAGHQVFVICPLVEESEALEAKAATAEFLRLQGVFPDLRLDLLHGRMGGANKDTVMRRFRAGEADILVSTAVVEVGIDIPNATVMMVEGADRFGLSQLHQFRGRVGRGDAPSYCLLIADSPSQEAQERLAIMERISDGFRLAEEDLRLRGPGEFFGTRQSGLPSLEVARLSDVPILETARQEASALLASDRGLESPEHELLRLEMERFWRRTGSSNEIS